MNKIVKAVISVLASGLFLSAATFCWFINENEINFPASFGSTKTAYFAGGDGTEENPYQINSPVHLYNLAWLQYFGYFNLNPEQNNGAAQSHFVLTDNVDMRGFGSAIPPIGTAQFPFIGSFNGNDKTISGVTVSDKRGTAADTLKTRPVNAAFNANDALLFTDVSETVCITGLFGVTGNYGGYTDGYAAEHPEFTQENAEKMTVKNFYADKLHIKSNAAQTLAGLAAGYVGSNFLNVGVYRGDISFASGAMGISALSGSDTVVSKYSLVGAYDENLVEWSAAPTGGAGAGFGGSIDMKTLSRRVGYMITSMLANNTNSFSTKSYAYQVTSNEDVLTSSGCLDTGAKYNLNVYKRGSYMAVSDSGFYYKSNSITSTNNKYLECLLGTETYLPLNINLEDMYLSATDAEKNKEISTTVSAIAGTYYYNDIYKNGIDGVRKESVSSNTGYIVGGDAGTTYVTTAYVRLKISHLNYGSNTTDKYTAGKTIYKSLRYNLNLSSSTYSYSNSANSSSVAYTGTNLDLVTNVGGTFYRIVDSYNSADTTSVVLSDLGTLNSGSLMRYNSVRTQFGTMLEDDFIYGLKFTRPPSSTATITGSNVSINGTDYTSYQFIKSAINFNLSQSGYMTAVLGGYDSDISNSYNQFGFSLFEVIRDSSNNIVTDSSKPGYTREITSVWQNANGDIKYNYGATAVDNNAPETGYTKVYDKYWYNSGDDGQIKHGTAYYVEIPLKAGDYCLGGVTSDSNKNSAYLMYLDIGANGASGGQTKKPYSMQSVDFVNSAAVVTDAAGEYPDFNDVTFSVAGVGSGSPYTVFERKTTAESEGTTKVSFNYFNITDVIPAPENYGEYNSALAPAYD